MLTVITDKKKVSVLHRRFKKQLHDELTELVDCWVGYPSGSFADRVRYSPKFDIWISEREYPNRFWNGFGVGHPIPGKNNSLNGEINFPYEGINKHIAGVFASDEDGNIFVLHRGRIGGGKPGIGKRYFTDNFRGVFINAIEEDHETVFCLIGELDSHIFSEQVANFIREIYRIKRLQKGEAASDFSTLSDYSYTDEHSGQSVTENNEPRVINRTHGIIVNALARELENMGYKVANDRNRDLFIHHQGRISALFEIKTSSSTQCLYSAIGQLLLYSIPIGSDIPLFAVLPQKLKKSVENRFAALGISIIYFDRQEGEINFTKLDFLGRIN